MADADRQRVVGARVQSREPGGDATEIAAALVVDATGRGSRTPAWLSELGYPAVPLESVKMDLTYVTWDFHAPLPLDPIGEDIAIIPVATPAMPRGAIFARLPDRYAISLTGVLGERPPTDYAGMLEYVRSLPVPVIYDAVRQATPMGEPATFHFPASIRRRYERMSRVPDGLLVLGDAACVFNPVYGQGMTVAAIGSTVLAKHVRGGRPPVPAAYFRDLAKVIDAPWDMSAGADLGFPAVRGRRTAKTRIGNFYIPRLQRAAADNARLSTAFLRVAGLVDAPGELMRPAIARRVFTRSERS